VNNFIWHSDSKNRALVDYFDRKCQDLLRGENKDVWVDFQNSFRGGPIERRFPGEERLAKLKALKKEWDSEGVFTRELLD